MSANRRSKSTSESTKKLTRTNSASRTTTTTNLKLSSLPNLTTLAELQDRFERGIHTPGWRIVARVVFKDQIRSWSNKNGSGLRLSFRIIDKSRVVMNCICFTESVFYFDELINTEKVNVLIYLFG